MNIKRLVMVMMLGLGVTFVAQAQVNRENIKFNATLTATQSQYMTFLYQYMPLSDWADYTEEFFIQQVEATIQAKQYFSWGKSIPDEIFKHFVLPVRVNNENLDTARVVFFKELRERIKDLTMYDAIKEVNHWCHEKVNYRASDGRTSSPLATMKTSWGRCGEESTFTVAALRAVGIPARQCYTPRWAHTDDNHAWVEAWADGKWYYFGACEPDAELNSGWFDSPVKRAMMVHTTVFGKYEGAEQKNYEHKLYSKINLLSNYTSVKTLKVIVKDVSGKPIENAEVDFGLYNYAEYYPLSRIKTSAQGEAVLTTGLGDLMICVTDNSRYKVQKINAEDTLSVIILDNADTASFFREFILTPPVEKIVKAKNDSVVAANALRVAYEDSLREAYIHTFPQYRMYLRKQPNYVMDYQDSVIDKSWGNYETINRFFGTNHASKFCVKTGVDITETAKAILESIYEKDLRDVPYDVLQDHVTAFKNCRQPKKGYPQEIIDQYILNPRIQLEKLTSWRSYLQSYFLNQGEKFVREPQKIADWITQYIKLNNSDNYYGQQISPMGVLKIMECDNVSRDILFVAICRSFGIAARYEWATGKAQYMLPNKDWTYAIYEKSDSKANPQEQMTKLIVTSSPNNDTKPEYYSHFTLSKLINGRFQTLDYEYEPHFDHFPDTLSLSNGYYRLLTGRRADDGSVFVREEYFNLRGSDTSVCVTLPKVQYEPKVLANIDMEQTKMNINSQFQTLKSLCGDKGLLLAFVNPANEPTKHLIADFALLKQEFEGLNVGIVAAVCDDKTPQQTTETMTNSLPKQTIFTQDEQQTSLNAITKAIKYDFGNNFPLLVFVTPQGDVVFVSEGYRIASPDSVLKIISGLQ
ncbi:MAG: transglutaminase domain-containing protein [Bacteroidales bacterium]|jgi:transglutaminase-like putative cysteine protease|nr:transglutaminase domain-containing protein [Bacteroidales bacterium]